MNKRIIVSVFIFMLSLLLAGCGMGTGTEKTNPDNQQGSGGIIAGEVEPSLEETEPLTFVYKIKNQTEKEVTLEFSSSQRYDYEVRTKAEDRVYLFSSVALFMAVEGTEQLKQGEELQYEIDLNELGLEKGEYVLTAWMTPKSGKAYEVSKDVIIP